MCSIGLGHPDLKHIINGFVNDPLKLRPFFKVMTYLNIRKKWLAVKFLPMQTDFEHKKIQYEMVKDGAPKEAEARMKILEMDYKRWAN